MRRALSWFFALYVLGCSVPDVDFYDAAIQGGVDGSDAAADSPLDGPSDAAADIFYCGDSGLAPTNASCCPSGGPVCIGKPCNNNSCGSCAGCSWPQVCCVSQGTGVCKNVALCP